MRSHAAGIGEPVEVETVRAMMLLRVRSLAMGYSGARPVVAQAMLDLLNAAITPVVPEFGSVGASGDLAPLAHCALALMGEGEVFTLEGGREPAARALAAAGLAPVELGPKEGLALINGTDGMLAMLLLSLADLRMLLTVADVAAAMSVEALLGTDRVFAADLVALRPQPGQSVSASNLRALLAGSPIVASHREGDPRVQDAYSLRCAPQVLGAARDTVAHAERVAASELAAAIDNPMILPDGRVESCGNFHGAPLAFACDFLAIATAEVGAIAERRTDRLLDPSRSEGLPPFLAADPGVDSGLMIAQYTQAALVAENRRQAAPPASARCRPARCRRTTCRWAGAARGGFAPSCATSRGSSRSRRSRRRARLELRAPLAPGRGTAAALAALREAGVAGPGEDRHVAPELAAAERARPRGRPRARGGRRDRAARLAVARGRSRRRSATPARSSSSATASSSPSTAP